METAVFILIVALRLLVPLTILRMPFWGALLCIAADASDTVIQDALGVEVIKEHYHQFDKAFDLYYLAIEAWVVWRWPDRLARAAGLGLFALRVAGAVLYEITDTRQILLFGPNVFENFYLFVAGMRTIDDRYRIGSVRQLAVIVVLVAIPKLLQEYAMHFEEFHTWRFVKRNVLYWR